MISRIGVAGAAGAGKTTVANHLIEKHDFQLLGFATPLYKLGEIHTEPQDQWHPRAYGWGYTYLEPMGFTDTDIMRFADDVWDVMAKTEVIEGKNRTLLQLLGTEVGRAWDENLWTNIFEAKVEELGPDARIVNDNLRFPNEFDYLKRLDFVTVYLETPMEVRAARYEQEYGTPMNQAQLAHVSEAHLDSTREKCDFVYENTGKVDDLITFIDGVVTMEKVVS